MLLRELRELGFAWVADGKPAGQPPFVVLFSARASHSLLDSLGYGAAQSNALRTPSEWPPTVLPMFQARRNDCLQVIHEHVDRHFAVNSEYPSGTRGHLWMMIKRQNKSIRPVVCLDTKFGLAMSCGILISSCAFAHEQNLVAFEDILEKMGISGPDIFIYREKQRENVKSLSTSFLFFRFH